MISNHSNVSNDQENTIDFSDGHWWTGKQITMSARHFRRQSMIL